MTLDCSMLRNLTTTVILIQVLECGLRLTQVSAQECDRDLVPAEKAGYQKRTNRCEGFYRVKVAAKHTIELRGFTLGVLHYDIEKPGNEILISRPFAIEYPSHVRGSALSAKYYYRMDADLPEEEIFKWPVDDVLRPYRLDARKIRLYGWYTDKSRTIVFPVRVSSTTSSVSNDNIARMTFQISIATERLICRWKSRAGTRSSVSTDENVHYNSSEPIEVVLPQELSGRIDMQVRALVEDEGKIRWLMRDLRVDMGKR